ncbi:hypothetical protein PCIT_a1134 [Pseudoalteromonas citrea]|uniref:Uncharacterized protein n=1 Tax=Pseudoalteromonas citrea TaxID=43655 RepID=A0AAD4ALP8_9GAMM|nr:hypothetical protein PCIT_a1134 [Pseudoalteromonas citrea]
MHAICKPANEIALIYMLLTIRIQGAICICLHYFKNIDDYSMDKFRKSTKTNL